MNHLFKGIFRNQRSLFFIFLASICLFNLEARAFKVEPETLAYQAEALRELFPLSRLPQPEASVQPFGRHTFVFMVHGASDQYSPVSMDSASYRMKRVDALDSDAIKQYAQTCQSCNVILLHIQRGGAHWYTPNKIYATYLYVYSQGKRILKKHVPVLNAADPQVVGELAFAAQNWFPGTDVHFIYRGHPFYPNYVPGSKEIVPFDLSHKDSPYGVAQFIEGLIRAHLNQKFKSITLATCSMAYLEIAQSLAPFAEVLIASEVDVLQTLTTGFEFSFLQNINEQMSSLDVMGLMANSLLSRFQTTTSEDDSMMEHPLTVVALSQIPALAQELQQLVSAVRQYQPEFFEKNGCEIYRNSRVSKLLSDRHIQMELRNGKSENYVRRILKSIQLPSGNSKQLDLAEFLENLADPSSRGFKTNLPDWISKWARDLEVRFSTQIRLFESPLHSRKGGLSFEFFDKNPCPRSSVVPGFPFQPGGTQSPQSQ